MKRDRFFRREANRPLARRLAAWLTVPTVIAAAIAALPMTASAATTAQEPAAKHGKKTAVHKKEAAKPAAKTVAARKPVAAHGHEAAKPEKVSAKAAARDTHAERHDVVATRTVLRRGRHGEIRRVTFAPRLEGSGRAFSGREALGNGPEALRSSIAYMVDQKTGQTLYDKNSNDVVPFASVTKLMMSMVVLDSKAPLDEMITVTDDDRDMEKFSGSRLRIGSELSRRDMLHIALMASENRAAAALSRYYPGGRPAFIAAMNAKAKSLGMLQTHFENPAGLSKLNVSTARDLVKMVEAAYQYPLIREFSTDTAYTVNTGRGVINYHSTNLLVRDSSWDIGLQKTGFINESGICLVMQTTIDDRPVVMVLLDSVGRHSDFADAARLRNMLNKDTLPLKEADAGHAGTM